MPLTNPWPTAGSTNYVAETQAVITEIAGKLDARTPVIPRVGSGRRYSQRSLYGGGYGNISLGNNAVFAVPIPITKACTISGISAKVTTFAGTSAYLGIYADDGTEGPGTLLASGTVSTATTGVKTVTISLAIATPRLVWGAIVLDNAGTAWYALNAATEYLGADSSLAPAYILSKSVGSFTIPSTFPSTPDYWDGGGSGNSPLVYALIS